MSKPRLKRVLQPFVDREALAGAVVLVADRSKVRCVTAVGFADIAAGVPMRTGCLFWIASQTKPITATALMMLVEEGKVGLDDPVAKYLPEFEGQWLAVEQDAEHVLLRKPRHLPTVRQALCHTSGMPFKSAIEEPTLDRLPLEYAVRSYAMTPLQSEPGSTYAYSNAGINSAGRIIEVVSGVPYAEFLDQRLFLPLGMKNTTFWPSAKQLARLARSYKPNADGTGLEEMPIGQLAHQPLSSRKRQPVPGGGLFSTAADVARFCRMILNGGSLDGTRYLSEASVKEMTTRQTGAGIPESYGLGWSTGDGTAGHGGAHATNMNIDWNRGLITVYLVQHAGFPKDGAQSHAAFQNAAVAAYG
jgi:CubicO group peptidase (beta-lactamase class C family)